MRIFSKKNIIRNLKLPFKFVYLFLCNIIFLCGLFCICVFFKKRNRNSNDQNLALCLSHVAISFDGRIKKSLNKLIEIGLKVILIKPIDAEEDKNFELSGLNKNVVIKYAGLSGVFSHFPCTFDLWIFLCVIFSKANILYCHDVNTAFIGLLASRFTGQILVCDLHEWKSETTNPDQKIKKINLIQKKIYQIIERLVLKHADFVITVNDSIANEIKNFYKINRDIYIVKNIPEVKKLAAYNMKELLGIKPDAFVVYYIGQIAHFRNIDEILIAVSQCLNVNFVLQGTIHPAYLAQLKKFSEDLKISDRVFFLPPVAHDFIPSACQGADVGIFTCHAIAKSMYYSLPNKLFEYVIGEIPIISEDLPVVRAYITKYKIGTLINSKDPKTIVNAFNSYSVENKTKTQKVNVMHFKEEIIKNYNKESAVYYLIKSFERS